MSQPADEFALDVKLRNGRPIGEAFNTFAQFGVGQHVHTRVWRADVIQNLHDLAGKAALGKLRRALHEEHHIGARDLRLDLILNAHLAQSFDSGRHAPQHMLIHIIQDWLPCHAMLTSPHSSCPAVRRARSGRGAPGRDPPASKMKQMPLSVPRGYIVRCLVIVTLAAGLVPARASEPIIVFAAASLKESFDAVAAAFKTETGTEVTISYAGSLALARQIGEGAPADLFASADQESMDDAARKMLMRDETRVDLLGNALVVVAPVGSTLSQLSLTRDAFAQALGSGRVATGEVLSVPVGKYAKAALEKLGLWSDIGPRLAMTDNVRGALLFVARGEAPLGIVYATDAAAELKVKIVATFPATSHPPIVYPVALTKRAVNPEAARFLAYLKTPAARVIFTRYGFDFLAAH